MSRRSTQTTPETVQLYAFLQLLAWLVVIVGCKTIPELPVWQTPPSKWTNVDFETLGLSVFTGVMFTTVAVYCLSALCIVMYGVLVKTLRAVANAVRAVSSVYSNTGIKGVVLFALNMPLDSCKRTWAYRFVCRLVLGDQVAIVAAFVLPAALYFVGVRYGLPAFSYISGFIAGLVNPSDEDSECCRYSATSSRRDRYRRNPNLRYFCDGEVDGYGALASWRQSWEDTTFSWDFFQPILVYSVVVMYCLFIVAVLVFNRHIRKQQGTQTDSTGDLNGDSKGLSEKITQLNVQIGELKGRRLTLKSLVKRLKGVIQLADRKVQQQKIELDALREINEQLQAVNEDQRSQCQDLTEKLSKVSEDTSLNQVREQLGYEKGLRFLVTYGYMALKQLAGTFAEMDLGEHLLKLTREIEKKCESLTTAGIKSLDEVTEILGNEFTNLLKDASEYAAEIRLNKRDERLLATQNVVLLKRKLRKARRHTRSVMVELAGRQVQTNSGDNESSAKVDGIRREYAKRIEDLEGQIAAAQKQAELVKAGKVEETKSVNRQECTNEEVEGYKQEILFMRRELSEKEQRLIYLEQELTGSRALNHDAEAQRTVNQRLMQEVTEKGAVLQRLQQELFNALQREETLKKEIVQNAATLDKQAHEIARLSESEQEMSARSMELEFLLGAANQQSGAEGQQRSRLQDQLDEQVRQLSEKESELTQLRTQNDGLYSQYKGIENEMRELRRKHDQEKKEAGNARANAVADLQVKIIQHEATIGDLQGKLEQAQGAFSNSIDIVASQRIEELEAHVEKLKTQVQQNSDIELGLRKENHDLKQRLEQVGREQSTKKAVGSAFVDPAKARLSKLQRDVQNLRQEAAVMEAMRDRLANEIRDLKTHYEPQNDNREPRTPLTVQGLQLVLQNEKAVQSLSRP
ncbi:hypothetical protein PRK78_003579 [Emydomyces testavorans]|uniref:Uncharacterized protein n=1 Tax=Emydomyces testavorans TaxID=2070801 RepID=A0AAF0DGG7_9EURO|nr:hypothetical protein PRK78_003579 [Emydomyces testavorans]